MMYVDTTAANDPRLRPQWSLVKSAIEADSTWQDERQKNVPWNASKAKQQFEELNETVRFGISATVADPKRTSKRCPLQKGS